MSRRPLRAALLVAGVVPALLAFVLLMKVAVMMGNDRAGREEFHSDDFTSAAERFEANRSWNWFEPWIAPFDQGAAVHADGDHTAAVDLYDEALRTVPEVEECTVRINQALAYEALGDIEAARRPGSDQAIEHWQAGIETLAAGECPVASGRGERQTEEAAEVDRRLREKLQQEQERQDEQQEPDDGLTPQERELEERNSEGQEDRRDLEEGGGAQADEERRNSEEGEADGGDGGEEQAVGPVHLDEVEAAVVLTDEELQQHEEGRQRTGGGGSCGGPPPPSIDAPFLASSSATVSRPCCSPLSLVIPSTVLS
jgi:hypothetical protein